MITVSLNVTKIDKSAIIDGKNGKYLSLVMWENKNGTDQYGNAGFVTQDLGKERREAGEKGAILGNYRIMGERKTTAPGGQSSTNPNISNDDSDIPF